MSINTVRRYSGINVRDISQLLSFLYKPDYSFNQLVLTFASPSLSRTQVATSRISTGVLSKAQKPGVYRIDFGRLALFDGLRRASTFEIDRIVARLVEVEGCSIDQKDIVGDTPLAWAAGSRHKAVVELLLGRADIDPDKPGLGGQTPLMAACGGREGVVRMLLGWDHVNSNTQDEGGETTLGWAAYNGHEGVVKILLGRDHVNPNKPGEVGQIPLTLLYC